MAIGAHHLQQAWLTLLSTKLRSGLAMLGILIATASIVALLSCSQLATEKALAQFQALGTDLMAISLFQPDHTNTIDIPIHTWQQLPRHIRSIQTIAPYITTYQPISFEGHDIKASIIGAENQLANIIHLTLARGRFVSRLEAYEQVCVIGDALATQLQQIHYVDPIGQHLRIGNLVYTIIGVLHPWKENAFFNDNINQTVVTPLTGIRLLQSDAHINAILLRLRPHAAIGLVIDRIEQWVQQRAPGVRVYIRSAKQLIAGMKNQSHIFTILLTVIGGIALLVGGIGIMNVMLISVSERKKEIGIRKAIGATRRDIQHLFLIESGLIAICGGILGLVLGSSATWVIASLNHWSFHLLPSPLLIGFGISTGSGLFFGFYPAYRAANLNPIDALRALS